MKNTDSEYIAKQIKALRYRKRLSRANFAEKLGVTEPIIGLLEKNKVQCTDKSLSFICNVFKVDKSWFEQK